jgi:hypothetical protein
LVGRLLIPENRAAPTVAADYFGLGPYSLDRHRWHFLDQAFEIAELFAKFLGASFSYV